MKQLFFFSLFLFVSTSLFAQLPRERLLLGIHVGGVNGPAHEFLKGSIISNLPSTLIRPGFDLNTYEVTEKPSFGYTGGFFVYYKFVPWVSFQTDMLFSRHIGGYDYTEKEGVSNRLDYQMRFKYWYGNLLVSLKGHLAKEDETEEQWYNGFFLRTGVYAGLNLKPENITYKHAPEEIYGPSEYVEQELRAVLKGKSDFGFAFGLGFETEFRETGWGFFTEARYNLGIADVIKNEPNGYGFKDQENKINSYQLTVGIVIPLQPEN